MRAGAKMARRLTLAQLDALDAQDREHEWGRYERIRCSDGRYRPRWQVQMTAARAQTKDTLRTGAGFVLGRYTR